MRKALFALLAAACVLVGFGANTAIASERQVIYPGENIGSSDWNLQARHVRIEMGTWLLHALNLEGSVSGSGTYSNLTVSPGTGLFVTVGPSAANTRGAVYQVVPVDVLPMPSNAPNFVSPSPSPLPTDSSLIVVPAFQLSSSSQIGPLTAPGAGLAVYWLIEAQISTTDVNVSPRTFIASIGTRQSVSVPVTRQDQIVYQAKSGTPAASPAMPTPDAGWIGVANVYVANGQSSITTGNVTGSLSFSGFAQGNPVVPCPTPGSNVTITGTNLPNCTINATLSSGGSFSGGVGVDANLAPSNGFACGIANTTACKFKATTGTSTTTGYTFDTTTACHAATDSFLQFRVLGANEASLDCSGDESLAGGIGLNGNSAPSVGMTCGVANSLNCAFTATTGASTTTGFAFNTTTGCHSTADSFVNFYVNSTNEESLSCSGALALASGIGLGGNAAPANGITCGVANTTPCSLTATTGSTTDTGFVFNTTSTCHSNADSAYLYEVHGSTEAFLDCVGDFNANGNVNATGKLQSGLAVACGQISGYHVECGSISASVTCASGSVCSVGTFAFSLAYSASPRCVASANNPATAAAASGIYFPTSVTTGGAPISVYANAAQSSTTDTVNVICVGV